MGGPIRTIANMCDLLGDEFDFWIFTRDRDLGSRVSYPNVHIDEWGNNFGCKIFYASPGGFSLRGLLGAIKHQNFDLLYINSFFSFSGSICLCIAASWSGVNFPPVLLAPRGEFSPGALAIKPIKKKIYILLSQLLGVYKKINFHASTKMEADEIRNVLQNKFNSLHIAPDLLNVSVLRNSCVQNLDTETHFRAIFISRISPKKNLDGLLKILGKVNFNIKLSIYGPIEDEVYWHQCESLMCAMPDNISISYLGELNPVDVAKEFARHHVFLFPTHGENFGHVIFESLSVGTPVMLSDNTPWLADNNGAVQVIPNDMVDSWCVQLEQFVKLTQTDYNNRRRAALEYAKNYIDRSNSLSNNTEMLRVIASTSCNGSIL